MTPFCRADPNMATKGFRFWESGFWAGALSGKPYHISALFVADLAAFRSIRAAGGVRAPSWASEVRSPVAQLVSCSSCMRAAHIAIAISSQELDSKTPS